MYRPNYHRATRNAYRTLLATGVETLPVDINEICHRCRNTKVLSYREVRMKCDDFDPLFDGPSRTAYTLRRIDGDQVYNIILWNEEEMNRGSGLYRFSLAHELGHIVLRHSENAGYAAEMEANVFAQHLLCPRPVLEVLQPADAREVSVLCGVSMTAAQIVLGTLRQENRYVDQNIWNSIFAAFGLDEKRSPGDHMTLAARIAMAAGRRRSGCI